MLVEDNIHVELKGLKGLDRKSNERKIEECSMVVKSKSMRTEKTEVDETVLISKYSHILPISCQRTTFGRFNAVFRLISTTWTGRLFYVFKG